RRRRAAPLDGCVLDADASREDVSAMALSMSAEIAEAWFNVVNARAKVALLEEQQRLDETYLDLVRLRFREGLANAVDVHQQRLQAAQSASQIELTQLQTEIFEQQLALLLGTSREALALPARAELPGLPPPLAPGVAANLVEQRPDIRAAQRRLEAADRRVAAAIAGRLPSIRLSVTPGYTWNRNEFGDDSPIGGGGAQVSSGFTLQAGASLDVPLFDGFLGRSQVRASRAQVDLQIATLQQSVVQALFEVESAIRQEARQRRNVELLREQAAISDETLESARSRYRSGLSDYLPVLTALQARRNLATLIQDAEREVLSSRIQLYRALGGDWPRELDAPEPAEIREARALRPTPATLAQGPRP
ncbi:MAG: TolC family protein, partial [Myxococcota bacterium]